MGSVSNGLDPLERLVAIEEIKSLKARYFRFVDTKQWDDLRSCFTADATLEYVETKKLPMGRDLAMTMLDYWLVGTATVHQGYMPEIQILSATTASGIWAMSDHHHAPTGPNLGFSELKGSGHYHETYEFLEGKWLIKSLRLTRLYVWTSNTGTLWPQPRQDGT
jgi:hypothetical protein